MVLPVKVHGTPNDHTGQDYGVINDYIHVRITVGPTQGSDHHDQSHNVEQHECCSQLVHEAWVIDHQHDDQSTKSENLGKESHDEQTAEKKERLRVQNDKNN